jgi:hypothetical protein
MSPNKQRDLCNLHLRRFDARFVVQLAGLHVISARVEIAGGNDLEIFIAKLTGQRHRASTALAHTGNDSN